MRAATWHNTWERWVKDVVRDGGQGRMMQEEDGTHGAAHEGGMQAGARVGRAVKQQQEAVQVRRQGEWWVHVRGTPVARMAHAVELGEDEGMLQSHDLGEEQLAQPAHVGLPCNGDKHAHTQQQCMAHGVQRESSMCMSVSCMRCAGNMCGVRREGGGSRVESAHRLACLEGNEQRA